MYLREYCRSVRRYSFIFLKGKLMSKKKELITDLTQGKVLPVLLKFAWPVMMANLLQTVYNMVDMVIVGNYVGEAGLSAVSIGGDILHLFTFLCMGFALAGQIMISQYVGAGKRKELNSVIGTLFTFIILLGAVMTIISLIFTDAFLKLLNVPDIAYNGAKQYTVCTCAGMLFMFGYNTFACVLRGMGDSKHPMIFICLAAVLNIILDFIFVGGMGAGAFGAALATVIAQGASCVLCLLYLIKHKVEFCFDFKPASFRITKEPLKIIIKLGIPIAIQNSAASISALFVSSFVNSFGVTASAVTGVGNKLNSLALIVANAMNTSGAAQIGQSFGGGKTDRIKAVVGRVFLVDFIFVSALSIIMLIFPEQIFSIFNSSPDVLAMSHEYAPVAAVSFMGFAFRSPSLALINGLGNSKMNFAMGVVEGFILRIGLCCLMGITLGMGIYGFWYGSTIASYGYGLVVFPYFFSGKWKYRKRVIAE